MRNKLSLILQTVSLLLIMYISISRAWNTLIQQSLVQQYNADIYEDISDNRYDTEEEKAHSYNEELFHSGIHALSERLSEPLSETLSYDSLLNVKGDGIMGYVEIPEIGISLPISHYASDDALETGAGHLYGTSLPVGGKNSHAVITGHRGLPTLKAFTDLDLLKKGDIFILHVLDRDLCYEVDQITTVLPTETEELAIRRGEDLVTLVTCTPYGVNTHRLLVRGRRIIRESGNMRDKRLSLQRFVLSWRTVTGAGIFAGITGTVFLIYLWKIRRERKIRP